MVKRSLSAILTITILFSLFTFGAGVSVAAPPDQPSITSTTTSKVSLSWTTVSGADSYNIYRATSSNGVYEKVNTSVVTSSSYADDNLSANTRYYYKITSVSASTESATSEEASGLTEPDFGPNVFVFDSTTPAGTIQSKSDEIFTKQESNQFGIERYAMLFKPGTYTANIKVGFYTQVSGLGKLPDDVTVNGGITVDADWKGSHNATQNFWRSVENLAVKPTSGNMLFAVSQAAPIRRLHVKGDLTLHDQYGWASGGFMADTKVDGTVNSGSQQQWFTRNSEFTAYNPTSWNTTIVGSTNALTENWPTKSFTVVDKAPVIREKPFLTFDTVANQYKVFVPDVAVDKNGTSWGSGTTAGTAIPIENFLIANTTTPVETINAALDQGKNLLFTPGVYHFTDTVKVTKPNTVVLGLGLATLHSDNGIVALSVADVDGVKIAGLLFEAGSVNSPVLLQVGPKGSTADHSTNPTSLHDLYFRVGGDALAKADVSIEINSNNVIGDHFWVWRADHGTGAGWNSNTTINGMIVNGNDVTMYGLFVEHFHEYQTVWNGERGRTYFYQTEIPYDVPNQESWMSHSGTVNGYASYKVADSVNSHEAYGLGIYSNFTGGIVSMESGIEVPDKPGVKIHNATSVSLNKVGEITHIVNASGASVNSSLFRATFGDYVPRTVASIIGIQAATIAGKSPELPAVVTQMFTDATTKQTAVTWDSIDPSKYTSIGSFTVEGTTIGTLIKAVANVTVTAAPNVAVTGISISSAGNANTIASKDGTLQMSAVVTPMNADNTLITWSVVSANGSATSAATISSNGLLTAMKDGAVKVIAIANDGSGVMASQMINISGQVLKVQNISVTGQNSVTEVTYKGASLQMFADVQPTNANDKTYTWSVVNGTGTASIDASGVLKGLTDGTVNVIATAKDGSGVTGTQMINISGQSLVLGSGWTWVRESRDNWAINPTNSNFLKLTTIEGSWGGTKPSNILLRDPGLSDFSISTKLKFDADKSFEWAGLIVYQDDGNLISLGRQANGSPAAKQIRFSQVKAGTQTDKNYSDPVAPGDIYLKIDKVGTTYKGYYSFDGVTWTQVADTFTITLTTPKVGVFVRKLNTSIAAKPAEFSNFKLGSSVIPYWIPATSVEVTAESGLTAISTNGGTLQMLAQVWPANASINSAIWSVYNADGSITDKATINQNGKLTAVKNGQVKVIALANDGSGVMGSTLINISGQLTNVASIDVSGAGGASAIALKNGTLQMSAAVLPVDTTDQTVTWSVVNPDNSPTDKATISSSGLLTAYKNGQVKVVATANDSTGVVGIRLIDISWQVLTPPVITTASAGDGKVILSWNQLDQSVSYSVYQSTTAGSYGTALTTVSSDVYSYTTTNLENGTTYYFVTKATYPGGISEISNEVSATPQVPAPGAPTNLLAVSAGDGQVHLAWDAVDGATGYQVFQGTAPGSFSMPLETVIGSVYTYDARGLINGTTYYFVVKAVNPGGISEASNEVSATPQAPVVIIHVTGVTLNHSEISLNPSDSIGLTATVLPANATNQAVTWTTSNANVARVDENGMVTAVAPGTATIKVTTQDGGLMAECLVTVMAKQEEQPVYITQPTNPVTAKEPGVATITVDQLSKNSNGLTTIEVPSQTTEIRLPANTAELIHSNILELKSDALSLSIPSQVLSQLTSQLTSDELKGGTISLKLDPMPEADAQALINKTSGSSNNENKLAGQVYEFHLYVQTADGKKVELSKFEQPITIELKVPATMNAKLAGIYYIANDGTLTYIGGKINNDRITAEITHFSKYAVLEVTKSFSDVPSSHWASNVIKELAAKQIVEGTSSTTFAPERSVTRAEFTALLVRALKLTDKGQTTFTDVTSSDWYADAVAIAVKAGIVQGKSVTLFDANAQMTREEMVTLLVRAYEFKNGKSAKTGNHVFVDDAEISSWAAEFIQTAANLNLVQGRAANTFDPQGISTRAEAAQILFNLLEASKAL